MPPYGVVRARKWQEMADAIIDRQALLCPVCGMKPVAARMGLSSFSYVIECTNKVCKGYGFMRITGKDFRDVLAEWNEKAGGDKVCTEIDGKRLFVKNCRDCPFRSREAEDEYNCLYPWKPADCVVRVPLGFGISETCPMRAEIKKALDREEEKYA